MRPISAGRAATPRRPRGLPLHGHDAGSALSMWTLVKLKPKKKKDGAVRRARTPVPAAPLRPRQPRARPGAGGRTAARQVNPRRRVTFSFRRREGLLHLVLGRLFLLALFNVPASAFSSASFSALRRDFPPQLITPPPRLLAHAALLAFKSDLLGHGHLVLVVPEHEIW